MLPSRSHIVNLQSSKKKKLSKSLCFNHVYWRPEEHRSTSLKLIHLPWKIHLILLGVGGRHRERVWYKRKRDGFPPIVPAQHQGFNSIIEDLHLICTQANLKENKQFKWTGFYFQREDEFLFVLRIAIFSPCCKGYEQMSREWKGLMNEWMSGTWAPSCRRKGGSQPQCEGLPEWDNPYS